MMIVAGLSCSVCVKAAWPVCDIHLCMVCWPGHQAFCLGAGFWSLASRQQCSTGRLHRHQQPLLDRVPAQSGRDQCEGWLRDKGLMTMALVTPGVLNP